MRLIPIVAAAVLCCGGAGGAAEILVVDDPLDQSTTGLRDGGTFVSGGGWQAEAGDVRITYDLGQGFGTGRFEVDVRNFLPCSQPNNDKCHIMSMWQSENQSRDSSAAAGESHWIFRTGMGYFGPPCEYKLLTRPIGIVENGNEARVDQDFPWDPAATYHYSISWDDNGRVVEVKQSPGGQQVLYDFTHGIPFRLRYLLIGRDRETKPNYGEQPGVIYSNVKVFVEDTSGGEPAIDGGVDGGEVDGGDGDSGLQVVRLEPLDDTFAHPLEADLTHGDQSTVQVGGDGSGGMGRTIYFKFDLRGVTGSILSARLHLRATNAGGGGWITGVPDDAWSEETLTWNNRPMTGAQIISQLGRVEIDGEYDFDLTTSVYPGLVQSFAVLSVDTDGAAYGSKEHPEPDYRPYLELDLVGGSDGGVEQDAGSDGGGDPGSEPGTDPGSDPGLHPDTGADPGRDGGSGCTTDQDCPAGQTCQVGICQPARNEGSCGCAATSPVLSALLLVAVLAGLAWLMRIRKGNE